VCDTSFDLWRFRYRLSAFVLLDFDSTGRSLKIDEKLKKPRTVPRRLGSLVSQPKVCWVVTFTFVGRFCSNSEGPGGWSNFVFQLYY
jgi:hypothetical protein